MTDEPSVDKPGPAVPTNRQRAESWANVDPTGQVYALLAVADAVGEAQAAQIAAAAQWTPTVVGVLSAAGTAILEAFAAQTEAIRRIADALEPRHLLVSDGTIESAEFGKLEQAGSADPLRAATVLPAEDGNLRHASEQMRARLDEVGEVFSKRNLEAIRDGLQIAQWHAGTEDDRDRFRIAAIETTGYLLRLGEPVCPSHGAHPHDGKVCLDCPQCPRATRHV